LFTGSGCIRRFRSFLEFIQSFAFSLTQRQIGVMMRGGDGGYGFVLGVGITDNLLSPQEV